MKYASSSNSVLDRRTVSPLLRTSRVSRSISRPARRRVGRGAWRARAQLGSDPGLELGDRERLDDVVDRAGVQPGDAGRSISPRAVSTITGSPGARCSELAQHLHPVAAGQHQVEHDQVDVSSSASSKPSSPSSATRTSSPLASESALDEIDDSGFVLDQHDVSPRGHHKSPFIAANPVRREFSSLRDKCGFSGVWTLVGMTVAIPRFTPSRRDSGLRRLRTANRVLAVAAVAADARVQPSSPRTASHGHTRKLAASRRRRARRRPTGSPRRRQAPPAPSAATGRHASRAPARSPQPAGPRHSAPSSATTAASQPAQPAGPAAAQPAPAAPSPATTVSGGS